MAASDFQIIHVQGERGGFFQNILEEARKPQHLPSLVSLAQIGSVSTPDQLHGQRIGPITA